MPKQYRAFKLDFVAFMRGMWPTTEYTKMKLGEKGQKIGNSTFTQIKTGRGEAPHHAHNLIELIYFQKSGMKLAQLEDARKRLLAYLQRNGVTSFDTLSTEQVLEQVCDGITTIRAASPAQTNWLTLGLAAVARLFDLKLKAEKYLGRATAKAVPEFVYGAYATLGQDLASDGEELTVEEAVCNAERHVKLTVNEYSYRAMQWLATNPWTVVQAMGRNRIPTGVMMLLPLTPDAYARVRSGDLACYDCGPADMQFPSRHLCFQLSARRPPELKGDAIEPSSRAILACGMIQVAVLSQFAQLKPGEVVHILSGAGSPMIKKTLISHKYKPIGKKMATTGTELFERTIGVKTGPTEDAVPAAFLMLFSTMFDSVPPE